MCERKITSFVFIFIFFLLFFFFASGFYVILKWFFCLITFNVITEIRWIIYFCFQFENVPTESFKFEFIRKVVEIFQTNLSHLVFWTLGSRPYQLIDLVCWNFYLDKFQLNNNGFNRNEMVFTFCIPWMSCHNWTVFVHVIATNMQSSFISIPLKMRQDPLLFSWKITHIEREREWKNGFDGKWEHFCWNRDIYWIWRNAG